MANHELPIRNPAGIQQTTQNTISEDLDVSHISHGIGGLGSRRQSRGRSLIAQLNGDSVRRLFELAWVRAKELAFEFYLWLDTPDGRGVLKCTLAYTLGSLATFLWPIADFLGPLEGKHVVATITVYFHPARSAGSMIEAILIAIVAVAYAELVAISSMVTSVFVGSTLHLVVLAHVLVVVIFVGGGFGFIGWVKQRMSNPLVNVGSTLASLAIIGVVTRESAVLSNVFSTVKIIQVLKMLLLGIFSAAAVNLLIWQVSARELLTRTKHKASISLCEMLSAITGSFLSGTRDPSFDVAAVTAKHDAIHSQMTKTLREAMFEFLFLGFEDIHRQERLLVKSLEALGQSIGGLRSAACARLNLFEDSEYDEEPEDTELPLRTPRDVSHIFIKTLRPAMQSLAADISMVLKAQTQGDQHEEAGIDDLQQRLADSLRVFNTKRLDSLQGIYNRIELATTGREIGRSQFEEVAAACGHFSFSLQSFAEETQRHLEIMSALKRAHQNKQQSWWWLDSPGEESLIRPISDDRAFRGIPDSMIEQRDTYNWHAAPGASKILAWISQKVLRLIRKVARDDVQFGLKVGMGAALWAMFAFIDWTRDVYRLWRGEWGLVSFMIVCSMTVGAANTTGLARFFGTLIGAAFSVINWKISHGYAVVLIVLGSIVSFLTFYFIVVRGLAPLGRITLLSYNVSTLYAYSMSVRTGDGDGYSDEGGSSTDILEIVKHRAVSVTAGILWGLVVCRLVWPISARRKFREGIAVLHLQMGLIWKRGPLAILLRSDCSQNYLRSGEHTAMRRYASRLEDLRKLAASEFDLRGPFPYEVYGRVMGCTRRMLDLFYAMSLVAHRQGALTEGENALLQYTAPERSVLCDRICHVFQVLASSTMLEYPLTDAVPSVMGTRDQLVSRIFQFRKHYETHANDALQENNVGGSSSADSGSKTSTTLLALPTNLTVQEKDYALLYAYALVTGQVAEELKELEREIEGLFGILDEEALLLQ